MLKLPIESDKIEVTDTLDKSSFSSVLELEARLKYIEKWMEGRERDIA